MAKFLLAYVANDANLLAKATMWNCCLLNACRGVEHYGDDLQLVALLLSTNATITDYPPLLTIERNLQLLVDDYQLPMSKLKCISGDAYNNKCDTLGVTKCIVNSVLCIANLDAIVIDYLVKY
jgi:hypothetical protein